MVKVKVYPGQLGLDLFTVPLHEMPMEKWVDGVRYTRCLVCPVYFPWKNRYKQGDKKLCSRECIGKHLAVVNSPAIGTGYKIPRKCEVCGKIWVPKACFESDRRSCGSRKCWNELQSRGLRRFYSFIERNPSEKECCSCHETKTIEQFWLDSRRVDGRRGKCIACCKKDATDYRVRFAEVIRQTQFNYYWSNRDKVLEKARLWKMNNREKVKAGWSAWWERNKANNNNRCRRYRTIHPEVIRAINQGRRQRIKNTPGSFTGNDWLEILEKYDYRCLRCKEQFPFHRLQVDHVIPISMEHSSNDTWNLQPLCDRCNPSKGDKYRDYRSDYDAWKKEEAIFASS